MLLVIEALVRRRPVMLGQACALQSEQMTAAGPQHRDGLEVVGHGMDIGEDLREVDDRIRRVLGRRSEERRNEGLLLGRNPGEIECVTQVLA